jgi:hypothetical protein
MLTEYACRVATAGGRVRKRYFDGAGLYLEVTAAGGRYWRWKYRYLGREKRLALGVYPRVSLKQARARAAEARLLLDDGTDPGAAKQGGQARAPGGARADVRGRKRAPGGSSGRARAAAGTPAT